MTSDVYNECVKALAYGYSAADVASIMEVTEEEVKNISEEKVAAKREELKGRVEDKVNNNKDTGE